jgi:hypothetical protein
MSSWQVGRTDQSTAAVPPATLGPLQQRVDNDFAPAWGVRADISVLLYVVETVQSARPLDPTPIM